MKMKAASIENLNEYIEMKYQQYYNIERAISGGNIEGNKACGMAAKK